jgi:SAM-dependent methyltransferase
VANGANSQTGAALARYYDLDVAAEVDDIPIYMALASAVDGPVLELACGSGRIALPLAATGNQVTGVDNDPAMLDRARAGWGQRLQDHDVAEGGSLELDDGDMTTVSLGRRFDLVILGFNSILLLPDKALQQAAIRNMRRHLSENGRAIIDVWLPSNDDLALYDSKVRAEWTRRDEATGEDITKMTAATYDPSTRVADVLTIFESTGGTGMAPIHVEKRDRVRFTSAEELRDMFAVAGLRTEVEAGDYAMKEYSPHSERLITIAAPADRTGTTGPDEGTL